MAILFIICCALDLTSAAFVTKNDRNSSAALDNNASFKNSAFFYATPFSSFDFGNSERYCFSILASAMDILKLTWIRIYEFIPFIGLNDSVQTYLEGIEFTLGVRNFIAGSLLRS